MNPTRSRPAGLSTSDLDRIRDTLAGGRKPKVMFTEAAGQIAGEIGQVVQLRDPDLSDEWLVVRFGHDELPFSPADLKLPPRNGAAGRSIPAPVPPPRQEQSPAAPPPAGDAPRPSRAPRPARPRAPKTPPAMTVTLTYQDGEWTVAAHQGSRALVKPHPVKPVDALKLVGTLDVPAVHEAVVRLVAAERTQAERQAEQLRTQLAEVEAHLAELRTVR